MLRPTIASFMLLCAVAVAQSSTTSGDSSTPLNVRVSSTSATSSSLPEAPSAIAVTLDDSESRPSLEASSFEPSAAERPDNSHGKTIDRNFILLHTLSAAAMVADLETTVHSVAGRQTSEMNPLFGARPTRARLYGVAVPLNILSFYVSYHYKKTESDRKFWTVSPVLSIAVHTGATINNLMVGQR